MFQNLSVKNENNCEQEFQQELEKHIKIFDERIEHVQNEKQMMIDKLHKDISDYQGQVDSFKQELLS